MNIFGTMSNFANPMNTMNMGMNSGLNINRNLNSALNLTDISNFSKDTESKNSQSPSMALTRSPFAEGLSSGNGIFPGYGQGFGMTPGFSGCCCQAGSMFAGMLRQQQQMMQLMMMMMQMMMMMMQNGSQQSYGNASYGTSPGAASATAANGGNTASSGSTVTGGVSSNAAYNSDKGSQLANSALKWDGVAFKAGQSRRCADWVSTVIEESGVAPAGFKHQTGCTSLQKYGEKIDPGNLNNLKPGDLVYFRDTYTKGEFTHVGIYVGDGKFTHRCTSNKTVQTDSLKGGYWGQRLSAVRRLN